MYEQWGFSCIKVEKEKGRKVSWQVQFGFLLSLLVSVAFLSFIAQV